MNSLPSKPESRRVPQLDDDNVIEIWFPLSTEEWFDDVLGEFEMFDIDRTSKHLVVTHTVGGNCHGIAVLRSMLDDIDDACRDANVDPMEFEVHVYAKESSRAR